MVRYITGNILDAETEAVVNTVNTVGVMGKGIALMFKQAYPENFREIEAGLLDLKKTIENAFLSDCRFVLISL